MIDPPGNACPFLEAEEKEHCRANHAEDPASDEKEGPISLDLNFLKARLAHWAKRLSVQLMAAAPQGGSRRIDNQPFRSTGHFLITTFLRT